MEEAVPEMPPGQFELDANEAGRSTKSETGAHLDQTALRIISGKERAPSTAEWLLVSRLLLGKTIMSSTVVCREQNGFDTQTGNVPE